MEYKKGSRGWSPIQVTELFWEKESRTVKPSVKQQSWKAQPVYCGDGSLYKKTICPSLPNTEDLSQSWETATFQEALKFLGSVKAGLGSFR